MGADLLIDVEKAKGRHREIAAAVFEHGPTDSVGGAGVVDFDARACGLTIQLRGRVDDIDGIADTFGEFARRIVSSPTCRRDDR